MSDGANGGYGRGLAYLRQQREANQAARGSGDHMPSYWPNNREIYEFWFTQEPDAILGPMIHPTEGKRRDGSTYPKDVLCARFTYDEPKEKCPLCVAGEKGPWSRYATIVWVVKIFHKTPPADLVKAQSEGWTTVKRGGTDQLLYVEPVNAPRFFMFKDNIAEQIESAYAGDIDDNDRKPTVLDRPFRLEVTGEKQSRVDNLKPLKVEPMPKAVKDGIAAMPSVEDTLVDKLGQRKPGGQAAAFQGPPIDTFEEEGDPGPVEPFDEELVSFDDEA